MLNDYGNSAMPKYGPMASDDDRASVMVPKNPYGYTSGGLSFLVNNADSYVNATNQQVLWDREDSLRKQAEAREDSQLDRWIQAAKRNGINPVLLLDSIGVGAGSAASYSTSAAKTSNYESNARTEQATSAKVVGAIIAALAMVAAAAL